MFRFLHTADLHLDSPLLSLALSDPALGERVGNATRAAFARIVEICLAEAVDALLIAGDLYDRELTSMRTAAFLAEQLARLHEAGIRSFLIRGNHDAASSVTRHLALPPSAHLFPPQGGSVVLEEVGVALHGVSFATAEAPKSLLPRYPPPVPGHVNIGLMHTSLGGSPGHDVYAPVSPAALAAHGYDYWALGHIHARRVHGEAPWIVMPGMPQGRDMGETGTKSATLVTLEAGHAHLEERPTAGLVFRRIGQSLGEEDDPIAAIEAVLSAAGGDCAGDGAEQVIRLTLRAPLSALWRLRRDLDLLEAEARGRARARGLWLERLVLEEDPGAEERARGGTADENASTLAGLLPAMAGDTAFLARAAGLADDFVARLPPEIRDTFGVGPEERRALLRALAAEGIAEAQGRIEAAEDAARGSAPARAPAPTSTPAPADPSPKGAR